MGDVVDFPSDPGRKTQKSAKKPAKSAPVKKSTSRSTTLCRNGHHSWEVETDSRFDVKQGKLVTTERCRRCGKTRVRGT